uniref:Uncharacterized protein n=1 Tax=Timema poppense TaxID=170557 RepID=A0A7R9DSD0_TIMPO|nr:unnamed protein product [Timema poppensis]
MIVPIIRNYYMFLIKIVNNRKLLLLCSKQLEVLTSMDCESISQVFVYASVPFTFINGDY